MAEAIRFYLDEHVAKALAGGLRAGELMCSRFMRQGFFLSRTKPT